MVKKDEWSFNYRLTMQLKGENMKYKTSKGSKISRFLIFFLLVTLCFLTLYPFWYVFMYSLSDGVASTAKTVTFYPLKPTIENFRAVFANDGIVKAFFVSAGRTVVGTVLHLTVTSLAAYSLSKSVLIGKKQISIYFLIPMYFSGGLLPYYVLITKLHLINNYLVYILPMLFSGFHMLIMKSFFEEIPSGIEEAARIDGASDFKIFCRIVIPNSKPIIATIGLFIGVSQWNEWFDAFLFINKGTMYPLQTILQKLILESQVNNLLDIMKKMQQNSSVTSEALKMATVIVATVPIVIVYPFLQKYFVKGMLLGGVKE